MRQPDPKGVYTTKTAAPFLGRHAKTVEEWCRWQKVRATKLGRTWVIRGEDLAAAMETCK